MNIRAYLNRLPPDMRDLVHLAGQFAKEKKICVYLVGGVVRDLILGVTNFDLDIAVEGDGIMFASELARSLDVRLITHYRFQTATLITPKKIKLDIATCRCEAYPEPASLPVVHPGTIREDLARRDFTINALAIDLLPDNFGNLIDFYQGRRDLETGIVRILHNFSFVDDPTRIIRAIRFEQRFDFRIESHSLKLLKEAAGSGMLKALSPHRLRDEITLILKEPLANKCISRLNKLVGLDFIHKRLKLNKTNLKYLTAIKNEIRWFNDNFTKRRSLDTWLMYFIGLLSKLSQTQINQLCERFGLPRAEIKRIVSYKKSSLKIAKLLNKKDVLPSQIYRHLKPLSYEVILLIKARYKNKFLNRNIQEFLKYYDGLRFYIRGDDLVQMGLKPSPEYKRILTRVHYQQLDGRINSRQDALGRIKKWLSLS